MLILYYTIPYYTMLYYFLRTCNPKPSATKEPCSPPLIPDSAFSASNSREPATCSRRSARLQEDSKRALDYSAWRMSCGVHLTRSGRNTCVLSTCLGSQRNTVHNVTRPTAQHQASATRILAWNTRFSSTCSDIKMGLAGMSNVFRQHARILLDWYGNRPQAAHDDPEARALLIVTLHACCAACIQVSRGTSGVSDVKLTDWIYASQDTSGQDSINALRARLDGKRLEVISHIWSG